MERKVKTKSNKTTKRKQWNWLNRRSILKLLALSPLGVLLPKVSAESHPDSHPDGDWNTDLVFVTATNCWVRFRPSLRNGSGARLDFTGQPHIYFEIVDRPYRCLDYDMYPMVVVGRNVVFKAYAKPLRSQLERILLHKNGEGVLTYDWQRGYPVAIDRLTYT